MTTYPTSGHTDLGNLVEIFNHQHTVVSADGVVSATACGTPRLRAVDIELNQHPGTSALGLSDAATEAVARAMAEAREATMLAMASLPGLNPQMRQLLLDGQ